MAWAPWVRKVFTHFPSPINNHWAALLSLGSFTVPTFLLPIHVSVDICFAQPGWQHLNDLSTVLIWHRRSPLLKALAWDSSSLVFLQLFRSSFHLSLGSLPFSHVLNVRVIPEFHPQASSFHWTFFPWVSLSTRGHLQWLPNCSFFF